MSKHHYLCGVAVSALVVFACGGALAQTEAEVGRLDEIVVTARKTTENLQKAPASIVAVDGDDLKSRGIGDAQSLEKVLPSFNLRTQGAVTQIFIRGVGTRSDVPSFAAASAFVFNGIVVPRYGTFGLMYDLGNVQAISGPQGTLYGGSAAGGALNVNSARPERDYSGSGYVEVGNYEAVQASAAQNLPLGEMASLRGAFNYSRRDSFYDLGFNSQDWYAGRLSLLAEPTDNLTALFFVQAAKDNGKPIVNYATNPRTFSSDPYTLPPRGPRGNPVNASRDKLDNRSTVTGANIDWKLGENTFTYVPGYVDFRVDYQFFSGAAGNQLVVHDREQQQSHELRWNRTLGAWQLSAGAFYLHNKTDFRVDVVRPLSATTFATDLSNLTLQTNTSSAIFGQAVYSATDRLRFTLGARGSRDAIDAVGRGAGGAPFRFKHSKGQPDYKAGVDFDLAPEVLLYANVQTGYIPFGYNPDVNPSVIVPTSRLLAISGGVKSRFFDDRLEFNGEAYHYDYKDFQAIAFVSATGLSTVLKAKQATIYGVDVNVRALLTPNTEATLGFILQRARYDEFQGVGYNFSGNKLQNAPDVTLNAGLQHTLDLGRYGNLVGRVDTHYESGRFGNFNNFPTTLQKAFTKTDASLTYNLPDDRWSIQAFVRNIEDVAVFNSLSSGATPAAPSTGGFMPPRTYGLRVSANW